MTTKPDMGELINGLAAAIRDPECPVQFSPLLMAARTALDRLTRDKGYVSSEVIEAAKMARARLETFADSANAGRIHYDARELKRRIWASFAELDALLAAAPAPPQVPPNDDGWRGDPTPQSTRHIADEGTSS